MRHAAGDERIAASLELLSVGGRPFAAYEFTAPDTYAVAEGVLRVPEDLPRLGGYCASAMINAMTALARYAPSTASTMFAG